MNFFIRSGLFLMVVGIVACSGAPTEKPTAEPTAPAPTPAQTKTNMPGPLAQPNTTAESPPSPHLASGEPKKTRQFIDAPDRDLFRLTKELVPGSGDIPRTVPAGTSEFEVGRTDTFWLMDLAATKAYQSAFDLVLITPHAYWYVEEGLAVRQSAIERSALKFESEIYPAVTRVFGSEWNPGIDNDPRLTILNARLNGVGGYFSSTDEYPTAVRPRSNQRETIYINALGVPPGSANYAQVLAHELQHAVHWNGDASEDTWVNEGLAELSTSVALGARDSIRQFLNGPPTSLVNWPVASLGGLTNYGASSLFMHFLTEHYGGRSDLRSLLTQPEDSIAGIDGYLEELGYESRFEDVFLEWAAANIIDGDGILGYDDLDVGAAISRSIEGFEEFRSEIPQYAVEYTELESSSEPFTLSFNGSTTTQLLPVAVGAAGCWWGNSGDSIDSTLAYRLDLPSGAAAALEYEVWFEVEEDWDYVYVEVSIDGGQTWRIIETPATSPKNPIGNGFGPGYTGDSDGWVQESIDLSPYAGEAPWLRLQYVTDDAINGSGVCVRELSINTAGEVTKIASDDEGWQSRGFVFTDNVVRQDFQVQLITLGDEPMVRRVPLDKSNAGELAVLPPRNGNRLIVAVGSMAEKTRQPASYTLRVGPVE